MIHCPSCNTECPDNANFCLNCGISLKSQSKSIKPPHDESNFSISNEAMTQILKRLTPTSYAEKLFASKGKMQGERRVVTILFSDVTGSTTLEENLDPEEVLELMNGAFSVLIKPVMQYEGTIARLMGDAILAFFGAPIAHEDDPYRACRAALDILDGAREFSQKLEREKRIKGFGVRVGINTGLVVVAEVGSDLRVEYTAMGDEVNIAARMESAAEPGTILITESTRNLIKNDFEILSLGPVQVKGKSEPINTYRILDVKKSENTEQNISRFNSPLIGRDRELNELQKTLNELRNGLGGIVSIIGESGLGKSRLVSEIRKTKHSNQQWAEGRALTYTVNNSYWIARSILKNLLGFHQESSDTKILDVLYKKVETNFGVKLKDIYPYIEHFLWPSGGRKGIKKIWLDDSRALKGQIHYAVKEFLKKESIDKPVVLVCEDLQWSDSPSMDLVNDLLPLVNEVPILFILVYRLNENEKGIWDFHHKSLKEYDEKHKVIQIHPLSESESILLINNMFNDQKFPRDIQDQIVEKTEGNPSFLEEVVHSIIELDHLRKEDNLSEPISLKSELQIPNLLQSVIMARVDNLDPSNKITLQTSSVIGRIFQKNLLTRIIRDKLSESEFEKSLNELQLKEFILRHLPANIAGGISNLQKEYIFKQHIVQNVVYNSLLLTHRQSLHKQIGEEIENLHPNNRQEFADSLAVHFERGKVPDKAISYNRIAAVRAKELFANEDAIFYYSNTLKLSEEIQLESSDLAQIHESMGDIYSLTADYPKAIEHFKISLTHYMHPGTLSRIYYKCGQIFDRWGRYEKALEDYNRALALIHQEDEQVLTAHIYAGMGMVYFRQGKMTEAEKLNARALLILKENGNEIDIANVYNNMGIIYGKLGDLENSLQFHKMCLSIKEKAGISSGLAASNNNLGFLYQLKNNPEKAIEYYTRSLEYWEKIGNLHGLARTYDNLSQIYINQGKQALGMDYNLKAMTILGKIAGEGTQINSDVWLQSGVW
jgi:class 3 adenylate cyclase/predicted ATPase